MESEIWRPINAFPDYEISSLKRVRKAESQDLVHITHNGSGLQVVFLKGRNSGVVGRGLNKLYRQHFDSTSNTG